MQTRARSKLLVASSEKQAKEEKDGQLPARRTGRKRGPSARKQEPEKEDGIGSPYFTPPRCGTNGLPPTPISPSRTPAAPATRANRKRKREAPAPGPPPVESILDAGPLTPQRPKRSRKIQLPPTPESLPKSSKRWRRRLIPVVELHVGPTANTADQVVAPNEKGVVEAVDKILLLQGRAVKPIYWELLRLYPTPQALAEDLTALIYPLGLFNQRAASLIRFSQQYLSLSWPIMPPACLEATSAIPFIPPRAPPRPRKLPELLDVTIFYGAGVYASDSFRIYSSLLPGRGGPEEESKWLDKRRRALARLRSAASGAAKEEAEGDRVAGVEEVGEYISDEEGDDDDGYDEWRKVRAQDKELRRYLIWRWGLEGIAYDIVRGPQIKRARDRRRLSALLED